MVVASANPEVLPSANLLDELPLGLMTLTEGRIEYANDSVLALLSRPPASLNGADFVAAVVSPAHAEAVGRRLESALSTATALSMETRLLRQDGSEVAVELELRAIGLKDLLVLVRDSEAALRGGALVAALSTLSLRIQREQTVHEVLSAACSGLRDLGFQAAVLRVGEGDRLVVGWVACTEQLRPAMHALEQALSRAPELEAALTERRAIRIEDFGTLPARAHGLEVLVVAPLVTYERPWGFVLAFAPRLASADLAGFSLFGAQLSSALELRERIAELERKNRELESVHAVAIGGSDPDLDALGERLGRIVGQATDSESVALYLLEDEGRSARRVSAIGYRAGGDQALVILDGRVAREVVQARRTMVLSVDEPLARSVVDPSDPSLLCAIVPMVNESRAIGMVYLGRRGRTPFAADQLRLAELLAAQIGIQLAKAELEADARRRLADLSLINELGATIAQHLDLSGVLATAMHNLSRLVDVPHTFLMLLDEKAQSLRLAASNLSEGPATGLVVPLSRPSVGASAVLERRPVVVEEVDVDPRTQDELTRRFGHRIVVALPMFVRAEPIGVLLLCDVRAGRRFGRDELARGVAIANQLAGAIANASLYEDLKTSYEELARAQAELIKRERLAALGELSAQVAHEVRNPLGVIFNSLVALKRAKPEDPSIPTLLSMMGEEADRLNRIVGDLLDFARPHEPVLQRQPVDALVRGALGAAERLVAREDVRFEHDVEAGLPAVSADERMLRQALVNLLLNATQALPQGGRVRLRAVSERRAHVEGVALEVSDTGPGVPPELVERIFQPFFTTRAAGTGLGLAVVKRIVDAHRGELSVRSPPGEGATFSFWLPVEGPA